MEEANRLREIGNQHYENEEFMQAEDVYSQALRYDPNDCKLYGNRSAVRAKLETWNDSLSDAIKSTDVNPEYVKGWHRQGKAHEALQQWSNAADAYIRCLDIDQNMHEEKKQFYIQRIGDTVVKDLLEKMHFHDCKETLSSVEDKQIGFDSIKKNPQKWLCRILADFNSIKKNPQKWLHRLLVCLQINNSDTKVLPKDCQSNNFIILCGLGCCYHLIDCYNEAVRCYQASRAFPPYDEDTLTQSVELFLGLASSYTCASRFKPATIWLEKASTLARECNNPDDISFTLLFHGELFLKRQKIQERNNPYTAQGHTYRDVSNYREAEKSFQEIIEICTTPRIRMAAKSDLAKCKLQEALFVWDCEEQKNKLLQAAVAYARDALDLAEDIGDKTFVLSIQSVLGKTLLVNQQYDEAKVVLKSAIELGRHLQAKERDMLAILWTYASCLLLCGSEQENQAIEPLKEAQTILSSVWKSLIGDRMMIEWRNNEYPSNICGQLALAYWLQNDKEHALETMEYDKCPALLEQLGKYKGIDMSPLPYGDICKEAQIRSAVVVFYGLFKPLFFTWVVTPNSAEVQCFVLHATSDDAIETVNNNFTHIFRRAVFEELINRTDYEDIRPLVDDSISQETLKKYHDDFWKPLSSILQDYNEETPIYILPEGKLWNIPFAALLDDGNSYLVEHHTIIFAPSVGVLKTLRENKEAHVKQFNALVVGNPTMPTIAGMHKFSSLCYAEQEAEDVSELLRDKGYVVEKLCREAAKKKVIVDLLKKSTIAHVATHGFLRSPSQVFTEKVKQKVIYQVD